MQPLTKSLNSVTQATFARLRQAAARFFIRRTRAASGLLCSSLLALSLAPVMAGVVDLPDHVIPDAVLTPGAVASRDLRLVCSSGYAQRVRPRGALWRRLKDQAYLRYGLPRGKRSSIDAFGVHHAAYEVDHLIPLELGGDPVDLRNLWPQSIEAAKRKDRVENQLHRLVCGGRMSLSEAQGALARNWRTAFRRSEPR